MRSGESGETFFQNDLISIYNYRHVIYLTLIFFIYSKWHSEVSEAFQHCFFGQSGIWGLFLLVVYFFLLPTRGQELTKKLISEDIVSTLELDNNGKWNPHSSSCWDRHWWSIFCFCHTNLGHSYCEASQIVPVWV